MQSRYKIAYRYRSKTIIHTLKVVILLKLCISGDSGNRIVQTSIAGDTGKILIKSKPSKLSSKI